MPAEIREMLTANAQEAVQVYIKFLSDGDPRVALKAAELVLDRAYGKVQPAAETVSFEVPENSGTAQGLLALHGAVINGVAAGEVPLSEARDLSAIIETHRKIVETIDLEARIAALEANQKGSHA